MSLRIRDRLLLGLLLPLLALLALGVALDHQRRSRAAEARHLAQFRADTGDFARDIESRIQRVHGIVAVMAVGGKAGTNANPPIVSAIYAPNGRRIAGDERFPVQENSIAFRRAAQEGALVTGPIDAADPRRPVFAFYHLPAPSEEGQPILVAQATIPLGADPATEFAWPDAGEELGPAIATDKAGTRVLRRVQRIFLPGPDPDRAALLATTRPLDTARAENRRELWRRLGFLGLVALAGLLLATLLSRSLAQPLDLATRTARDIESGDLAARFQPDAGPAELREFGDATNRMIDQLDGRHRQLRHKVETRGDELASARAQLSAVFESIPEGLLVTDLEGRVLQVNQHLGQLFRPALANPTLLHHLVDQLRPQVEDADTFEAFALDHLRSMDRDGTLDFVLRGHPRRHLRLVTSPVHDSDDKPFARLWLFADITEHIQLDASLREVQKTEAMGQLAGGIAHDFKNYLGIIIGNLHHIGLAQNPADRKACMTDARNAAERAAALANQLMRFSQRVELHTEQIDTVEFLQAVVQIVRGRIPAGVQIELDTAEQVWPIRVDTGQMERVFLNLCINAVDAMPAGGTISITARNLPSSERISLPGHHDMVEFTVTDTGTGIPPDVKARVFEPFFSTKPVGGETGNGLGLYNCLAIIQDHSGSILCDSEVGQGTTFRLLLPRATNPVEDNAHILVVDDDHNVLEVIEQLLLEQGFRVTTTATAEAAIAQLNRADQVDLVLLDLVLPGDESGVDVFRHLRDRGDETPVIVCTGFPEKAAQIPGETEVVTKPFNLASLVASIRRTLGQG